MKSTSPSSTLSYDARRTGVQRLQVWFALWASLVLSAIGCKATSFFSRKTYSKPSIGSPSEALSAIRESNDPALRRAAFEYLGNPSNIGVADRDETSAILALALSSEPQAQTRITILQALAQLGSPKRWESFNVALKDKEPAVRLIACRLVGRSGNTEQTKALDDLLISDPNLDVRLAAADALSNIPTREAALALLSGVQDTDVAVRYRCRQSLQHITGKDHGGNVDEWRSDIQTANFEELATHRKPFGTWW